MPVGRIAALPAHFQSQPLYAKEYLLALIKGYSTFPSHLTLKCLAPPDASYAEDSRRAFEQLSFSKPCLYLNLEYKVGNLDAVTLYSDDGQQKQDIVKQLISDGYALVEKRREARLQPLVCRSIFHCYTF